MLGYMAITIITMLFTYTKLVNPEAMLWGRTESAPSMTIALWAVYRMIPCRITKMVRIIAQMALLATGGIPTPTKSTACSLNLDHIFAGWGSRIFWAGQPAPALCQSSSLPWAVPSELMSMGYFMYYPMIALVSILLFLLQILMRLVKSCIRHDHQFLYDYNPIYQHLCTGSGSDLLL